MAHRAAATKADQKYIVCNADEGDSGTYADRMIMEGDPFVLIEGMTIAGLAVGATQGYIYIRSEYPHAFRTMQRAIAIAYEKGYLGANVAGSGKRFDLEVAAGRGRLHLRRRNVDAGEPGRQARPDPSQAAAAGDRRPVRQADGGQQRDLARDGADHSGQGRRSSIAISAWEDRAAR